MSANNQLFVKHIKDKWYGWSIPAESYDDSSKVTVHLSSSLSADTLEDLEDKLGYSEYGITTVPMLMKDGTEIEVKE